jgi:hypothetical protein
MQVDVSEAESELASTAVYDKSSPWSRGRGAGRARERAGERVRNGEDEGDDNGVWGRARGARGGRGQHRKLSRGGGGVGREGGGTSRGGGGGSRSGGVGVDWAIGQEGKLAKKMQQVEGGGGEGGSCDVREFRVEEETGQDKLKESERNAGGEGEGGSEGRDCGLELDLVGYEYKFEAKLVEVKGPGDTLMGRQTAW